MIENIDKVLDRGDRLELLVDKTANLQGNTIRFRKHARRFRSNVWWKNVKIMYVLILFRCLVLSSSFALCWDSPHLDTQRRSEMERRELE